MNHPLRKIMTGLILMAMSPQAFANDQNMKALFEQINKASKGALGSNVYQEPDSRRLVEQNGQIQYATSKTAFTAAFPSDLAAKLAAEEGLLLGHRFTTDYVALHKKFVAPGESATGFAINVEAFMSNPQIAPEMKNMVLQMILEKFYIGQNPNSKIAYGNLYRGSADADNERTFYNYFAKYLAKYQDPQKASDYLILFEMQRRFNLTGDTGSVSLESLRAEVASLYDRVSEGNKGTESDVTFMKIRNSIHNYMTPDVVGRLEAYLQKFNTSSGLSQGTIDGIRKLKARIETYYKVDKTALLTMAKKIPAAQLPTDFQTVLGSLKETGNTLQDLKKLSALVVAVVDQFKANAKNPEMIHFVIKTQAFLQNELARTKLDLATAQIRTSIAMDSIYASGLIPQSMYLDVSKVLSAQMKLTEKAQASALSAKLSGVLKQALALTKATFKPALDKWVIVSPQTEGVIDDTLRGSQMTELDQVITLLDGGGQTLAPGQMDVLMEGEAYGYLIYVPADVTNDQVAKLDRHSIAIFAVNPLFTGVLEATISEQYQGPLSHIKIKSDSRGTPNAFYPKASQDPMLKKFINSGKPVRISFSKKGGFSVTEVTLAEAKAVWDSKKKAATVEIFADLKEKRIRSTDEMGAKDFITVGAKTANYAEATHVLPEIVLKGWGIPFAYYKEFMETNYFSPGVTLQQYVEKLLKNPRMETDKVFQVDSLTALRARMTDPSMKVNPELVNIIA